MDFTGQNVLVLGLGLSGRSAARYCAERGARVLAVDERPANSISNLNELPEEIDTRLGDPFPELDGYDLIIPSPGIPAERWKNPSRRAWGDIELCYRDLKVPIIAVTGTNGKSTVVRLIEAMARAAGLRARAAGNLGIPALDLIGEPLDLAILEVSSFQLESVDTFRPRVAVLLNLSPDHFDRHFDLEGYLAAKLRIFEQQGEGDVAILNGDDPVLRDIELAEGVERLEFRRHHPVENGAWLDGQNAILRRHGAQQLARLDDGHLSFLDQAENLLAALLALAALDIDLQAATQALVDFKGLPHRHEEIAEIAGVRYVDDSKATNIGAAIHALNTTLGPILWIVGGRHKGGDLRPLASVAKGRVRRALLFGEAAFEFEEALSGSIECEHVGDLSTAVVRAAAIAKPGDVVLLAPACASFDQFRNFGARGSAFQAAVKSLASNPEPQRQNERTP